MRPTATAPPRSSLRARWRTIATTPRTAGPYRGGVAAGTRCNDQGREAGGKSVLSVALEYKFPPLLKVLMKAGPSLRNDALLTALGPLGDSHADQLRVLMDLATPAQIAARREDGSTPLHLAAASRGQPGLRGW